MHFCGWVGEKPPGSSYQAAVLLVQTKFYWRCFICGNKNTKKHQVKARYNKHKKQHKTVEEKYVYV